MFGFFKTKKNKIVERNTTNLKISVVMPVYLGEYEGCADNRIERFKSAVISFVNQSYKNSELIIISDGCNIAEMIYNDCLVYDNIVFKKIPKQSLFSGNVRAEGVKIASGDIIGYLDSDDNIGKHHLQTIVDNFTTKPALDWVYYNDIIAIPKYPITTREVHLALGFIGTSTIAHRKDCEVSWIGCDNYNHDWLFIQKLIAYSNSYIKIYGATYYVNHIK